ncbi:glycosyltransferase [Exiguobacterium chiriqhucha]|uniref:glycosyltransferase n=1 Tax=Exiguobacterium chiriqhucha TaxID=1385984 RepID=UPI000497BF7C|nr:glycosyltransferase [Exiguobacterium chiriqhucha]
MKIVLNCSSLISSGGFVSTFNLLKQLAENSRGHEYLVIIPENVGYEKIDFNSYPHLTPIYYRRSNLNNVKRLIYDNFLLKKIIYSWNADIVFSMGNIGPLKLKIPHVLMIRKPYFAYKDKYIYRNWSLLGKANLRIQNQLSKMISKNCDLLTVQTPVMKKRISENFGISTEKIKVIPNALIKENLTTDENISGLYNYLRKESVVNILALAQYYPHKNLEKIIEVAEELKSRNIKDFRFLLTIDEKQHPNVSKILKAIKEKKLESFVWNLGIVNKNDLSSLYKNVDYLIMPTFLETFGNPYIEAMYNKVPILASDFDFSRSVCKEAAVYFNTFDTDDIINKLYYAKTNDLSTNIVTGQSIVEESFSSWIEITDSYINELETVVKTRRKKNDIK